MDAGSRERAWPGGFNARDVGGVPLASGGCTRRGVVFRSGRATSLTDAGWAALRADGIRTIVDLRNHDERERRADDPVVDAGATAGVRVIEAPTEDPTLEAFRSAFSPYLNSPDGYATYAELFADRIAAALDVIADAARDGGVLVHCSAGRDRTGLLLGLVLRAAGATPETIADEDALAARAVNEHHGRRVVPHPYERFADDAAFAPVLAERRVGILAWLDGLDRGDAGARALEAAGALRSAERVSELVRVCAAQPGSAPQQ